MSNYYFLFFTDNSIQIHMIFPAGPPATVISLLASSSSGVVSAAQHASSVAVEEDIDLGIAEEFADDEEEGDLLSEIQDEADALMEEFQTIAKDSTEVISVLSVSNANLQFLFAPSHCRASL